MDRVFILGAGVSKHCGYPLTNDLLKEITIKANDKDTHIIYNILRYLYPNFDSRYMIYPNIEEVLSLVETSIELSSKVPLTQYNFYPANALETRKRILKNISTYFFKKLEQINNKSSIYEFAKFLNSDDVVISFNWDLNLEKALKYWKKRYSYDIEDKNRITILKPHGSINWFKRSEIKIKDTKCQVLIKNIKKNEIYVFKYFRPPKTIKDIIPYIVPPTFKKAIDTLELKRIWNDIYQVLSKTEEINVLGYSLPNIDLNSKYIFRTAIREKINSQNGKKNKRQFLVVNPDDNVYLTYRNLVGDPIQFERTNFEDLNFKELFE